MRRHLLGVLALLLIVGGIAGLIAAGGDEQRGGLAASIALRAGALLGAIWLALPQLDSFFRRFPPWLLAMVGGGALVIVFRPRLIVYLAPLAGLLAALQFAAWFLRPRLRGVARRETSRRPNAKPRSASPPSGTAPRRNNASDASPPTREDTSP